MILEGIVTSIDAAGAVNIAPMGPRVSADMRRLVLRPYQTSTTFANLRERGEGVFHVTDDVLLLARAAIGKISVENSPPLVACETVACPRLADCCRWYEFRVQSIDESQPRTEIVVDVVGDGRVRDFIGFNRAKHACVEAAILATRVGILPAEEIAAEMKRLAAWVEKTGGERERQAFEVLRNYIERK